MNTNNNPIFQDLDEIIYERGLIDKEVNNSFYAVFDSFNNSKKLLGVSEQLLCREFIKIIEDYKLKASDILEHINGIDYEYILLKKNLEACLLKSWYYGIFKYISHIESEGIPGTLYIDYYIGTKVYLDLKLEIRDIVGLNLVKKTNVLEGKLEFNFDGDNVKRLYRFLIDFFLEFNKINDELDDLASMKLSFISTNEALINDRIEYSFKDFDVSFSKVQSIIAGEYDNIEIKAFLPGQDIEFDVTEFSIKHNKMGLLIYLSEMSECSVTNIVINEITD